MNISVGMPVLFTDLSGKVHNALCTGVWGVKHWLPEHGTLAPAINLVYVGNEHGDVRAETSVPHRTSQEASPGLFWDEIISEVAEDAGPVIDEKIRNDTSTPPPWLTDNGAIDVEVLCIYADNQNPMALDAIRNICVRHNEWSAADQFNPDGKDPQPHWAMTEPNTSYDDILVIVDYAEEHGLC